MSSDAPRICVVGAGIAGVTSAFHILNKNPEFEVTIYAEKKTPDTTSDGAAGIWKPYILPDPRKHLMKYWLKATYDWLKELSRREDSPDVGIFQTVVYQVYEDVSEESLDWTGIAMGFGMLSEEELQVLHPKASCGFKYTSFIVQGSRYMSWLLKRFKLLGGKVVQRKVRSLSELYGDFDVVVNCSGLGARDLVGDTSVVPVRGQVIRVEAPWIKHAVFYHSEELSKQHRACYIIPQIDSVVIGGTRQDSYNTENSVEDTECIFQYCCEVIPSLKRAKIKQVWTGLRPLRPSVRVEKEILVVEDINGNKKPLKVVHNYGHGAHGFTLHHGCALDSAQLVMEILRDPPKHHPKL